MHIAVVGHVFNSISIIPNPESFSFQSLIMVQRTTDNGEGVLFSKNTSALWSNEKNSNSTKF